MLAPESPILSRLAPFSTMTAPQGLADKNVSRQSATHQPPELPQAIDTE